MSGRDVVPDRYHYLWDDLPGYRAEVVRLDAGNYYWHLHHREERINGGLSTSRYWAQDDAQMAAARHYYQVWLSRRRI